MWMWDGGVGLDGMVGVAEVELCLCPVYSHSYVTLDRRGSTAAVAAQDMCDLHQQDFVHLSCSIDS